MKRLFATVAAFVLSAAAASAASVQCGDFTYTLTASTTADCFSGNDTGNGPNGISVTDSILGKTGWVFSQKISATGSDDTGNSAGVIGNKSITFTDVLLSGEGGGQSGTWAVTDYSSIASHILITIKKQSGFAAFIVDAGVMSGTWNTFKTSNFGDNNIISHSSLFYLPGKSTPVNPVPLPAAGWLLIGGLGGLAALRRLRAAG